MAFSVVNTPCRIGAPSVLGCAIMWACYNCACLYSVTYETQNFNGTKEQGSPLESLCQAKAPINLKRPYCPRESPPQGESYDMLAGLTSGCLDTESSQSVMVKVHNGWSTVWFCKIWKVLWHWIVALVWSGMATYSPGQPEVTDNLCHRRSFSHYSAFRQGARGISSLDPEIFGGRLECDIVTTIQSTSIRFT